MTDSEPLRLIARQLLDESITGPSLADLGEGLRKASNRLQIGLSPILGATGTRLLQARAIRQAAAREPYLAGVAAYDEGMDPTNALRGKTDRDYPAVRAAFDDLLATFLQVLAGVVGPNLTHVLVNIALTNTKPDDAAGHEEADDR